MSDCLPSDPIQHNSELYFLQFQKIAACMRFCKSFPENIINNIDAWDRKQIMGSALTISNFIINIIPIG